MEDARRCPWLNKVRGAKRYVKGPQIKEGALNRVEAVIRCYDPCLSCSTHAVGRCRWSWNSTARPANSCTRWRGEPRQSLGASLRPCDPTAQIVHPRPSPRRADAGYRWPTSARG